MIQRRAGKGSCRGRAEPVSGVAQLGTDDKETMELIVDADVPTPDHARCRGREVLAGNGAEGLSKRERPRGIAPSSTNMRAEIDAGPERGCLTARNGDGRWRPRRRAVGLRGGGDHECGSRSRQRADMHERSPAERRTVLHVRRFACTNNSATATFHSCVAARPPIEMQIVPTGCLYAMSPRALGGGGLLLEVPARSASIVRILVFRRLSPVVRRLVADASTSSRSSTR